MRKDIKKDDTVIVLSGNYKKTVGKVLKVAPRLNKLLIEGVNTVKKHQKPSAQNPGGIIEKNLFIDSSNVALFDKKQNTVIKVGFKLNDQGRKVRFNKRTGAFID